MCKAQIKQNNFSVGGYKNTKIYSLLTNSQEKPLNIQTHIMRVVGWISVIFMLLFVELYTTVLAQLALPLLNSSVTLAATCKSIVAHIDILYFYLCTFTPYRCYILKVIITSACAAGAFSLTLVSLVHQKGRCRKAPGRWPPTSPGPEEC